MRNRVMIAVGLTVALSAWSGDAWAQEAEPIEASITPDVEEPQFSADELDALVAPIALYPDSLLAQIFVAATFPIDVIKADRLVDASADLTADARADAVEGEDWDPSVQVLTSGFPTVIDRMAQDIDWTEQLGDAVLVQTEDLLDAVQRLRAQAAATGYLATNEAQVVEQVDDEISIAPADPEVVYVPTYDPAMAYTTAPTAAPVYVNDPGYSTTDLLTTGAIAFGSAFLVNEIFDDDDDWDNYWGGSSNIDWDDGDFNPRPNVDIEGDVNINRGRFTNVDRDRVNVDRDRIGNVDADRLDGARDRGWNPSPDKQQAARDKMAARKAGGGTGGRTGGGADARNKLKAGAAGGGGGDARAKLEKASAAKRPGGAARRPESALKPGNASASQVAKARDRAQASGKLPQNRQGAASRPKPSATARDVSRPKAAKKPSAKRSPQNKSAFKKSGGNRAKASSSRGRASKSGRRR